MVLLDDAPRPDAGLTKRDRRRVQPATRWVGLVTVAYLAVTLRWTAGSVGLSHDGENLGVFAMGSRAMRELGLVTSRGGSILALGNGSYAHHPPLIVWTMYLSESVFGVHPWTARLPTTIAAVAVIWLLYGLLRDLRMGSWPAAIGVTVAVFSPMFLLYGWMPDTPILALPFGVAMARLWVRAGRDDVATPVSTTVVALAAVGALAGWEFSWWCAVLVVAAIVGRRHAPRRLTLSRPIVIGVVVGLAISVAWIWVSPDGIHGLVGAFSTRTGHGVSTEAVSSLRDNLTYAAQLSVPLALGLLPFAAWIAFRDRRARVLLGLSVVGVGGYAAMFWQASAVHDYWNEWLVLPVAIAFAAGASALIDVGRRQGWSFPVGLAVAVAAVCAVWGPLVPADAQMQLSGGARLGRELAVLGLPTDQPAWLVSGLPNPRQWISYVSGRPQEGIDDPAQLDRVAAAHPDWWIVTGCGNDCAAMARGGLRVSDVVINRVGVVAEVVGEQRR